MHNCQCYAIRKVMAFVTLTLWKKQPRQARAECSRMGAHTPRRARPLATRLRLTADRV